MKKLLIILAILLLYGCSTTENQPNRVYYYPSYYPIYYPRYYYPYRYYEPYHFYQHPSYHNQQTPTIHRNRHSGTTGGEIKRGPR